MIPDSAAAEATRLLAERTRTEPHDWHLVFKARYGMQVVFRALADVHGPGEIVTQVFTCSTAVDPILVGGLTPVYSEVAPATIAIDPDRLTLGAAAHGVVLQHTFGIIDDIAARRLRVAALTAGALLIEDSAHCVGRMALDDDGSPLADVSIHSFGVEKVLPTRFGGAVWVNPAMRDRAARGRIVEALESVPVVGRRLNMVSRANRTSVRILNRFPRAVGGRIRDVLTAVGAFEPAVAAVERRGRLPYPPMRPSEWMTRKVVAGLRDLDDQEARRGEAVAQYVRALSGAVQIPAAIGDAAPLVRFPFFARDAAAAERILTAMAADGVLPGRWYRPALFPGVDDPAAYGYAPGEGSLTTTEDLIARVVNLPTTVGADRAREIAQVVRVANG